MKEKPLDLQSCFVPHLGGLNRPLMTGQVFSLRELGTDLKNTVFTFKILVKPRDFVVKHYINIIYMRILKYFFLRFTIFEIIFIFAF